MVASLVGLAFACAGDWVGYLLVAPTLGWTFLRAFVVPARWTPRLRPAPYVRWWALSAILVVSSLVWWIALFHHVGQIDEWLSAGTQRGGGDVDHAPRGARRAQDLDRVQLHAARHLGGEGGSAGMPASLPGNAARRGDVLARPALRRRGPVRRLQGRRRRPHLLATLLRSLLRAGARAARGRDRRGARARGALVLAAASAARGRDRDPGSWPDAGRGDGARRREVALGLAADGGTIRRQRRVHPEPDRHALRAQARRHAEGEARDPARRALRGRVGLGAVLDLPGRGRERGGAGGRWTATPPRTPSGWRGAAAFRGTSSDGSQPPPTSGSTETCGSSTSANARRRSTRIR